MARLRIGDYHYFGLGTSVDFVTAASQYRLASEIPLKNAQAMFNLAYMFEMGLGMNKVGHANTFTRFSLLPAYILHIHLAYMFEMGLKYIIN